MKAGERTKRKEDLKKNSLRKIERGIGGKRDICRTAWRAKFL